MAESDIVRNEQLLKLIDEFREKVRSGMRDSENFMTLSKIERLWSELKGDTCQIYSDILGELISNADETDIIRKKKESS
ncbi:MAG: hypothetical protein LBG12_05830 [Synergistaceae bacterium]|jgi:hypothetical protein|nr:hypothetical protein [Synergistaceae bacterium]